MASRRTFVYPVPLSMTTAGVFIDEGDAMSADCARGHVATVPRDQLAEARPIFYCVGLEWKRCGSATRIAIAFVANPGSNYACGPAVLVDVGFFGSDRRLPQTTDFFSSQSREHRCPRNRRLASRHVEVRTRDFDIDSLRLLDEYPAGDPSAEKDADQGSEQSPHRGPERVVKSLFHIWEYNPKL